MQELPHVRKLFQTMQIQRNHAIEIMLQFKAETMRLRKKIEGMTKALYESERLLGEEQMRQNPSTSPHTYTNTASHGANQRSGLSLFNQDDSETNQLCTASNKGFQNFQLGDWDDSLQPQSLPLGNQKRTRRNLKGSQVPFFPYTKTPENNQLQLPEHMNMEKKDGSDDLVQKKVTLSNLSQFRYKGTPANGNPRKRKRQSSSILSELQQNRQLQKPQDSPHENKRKKSLPLLKGHNRMNTMTNNSDECSLSPRGFEPAFLELDDTKNSHNRYGIAVSRSSNLMKSPQSNAKPQQTVNTPTLSHLQQNAHTNTRSSSHYHNNTTPNKLSSPYSSVQGESPPSVGGVGFKFTSTTQRPGTAITNRINQRISEFRRTHNPSDPLPLVSDDEDEASQAEEKKDRFALAKKLRTPTTSPTTKQSTASKIGSFEAVKAELIKTEE